MKAIVLIGGFGTRLRPVTYTVPKQLIPIAGKPMLYHVLDLLPPEVDEAVLATGYKSDAIAAFVRDHPPKVSVRCVPEAEPLGTGGGMKNASEGISDPFVLLNSDVIAQIDVAEVLASHRRHGGVGTMTLAHVDDTSPYGVAALDASDRITRFVEKPRPEEAPSHWINAGLSVWNREVVEGIAPGRPVSFENEVLPPLLPRGVYGFRLSGFWEDAGTPDRLLRAQRLLFEGGRGGRTALPPGTLGKGPVSVGADATVRGATFGPYVTIGAGATVEAGAHVENSVVMDGARIGAGASVLNSLIGPKARVAAGHRVDRQVIGEAGDA
ncbi:MAG TPA: NDP-sugar synthase [Thermoplasmata archaeon]|nr:NDP-sugar synthase [Thermoplasmata archaeon]